MKIDLNVPVILFKENDVTIAYCPVLDLSGYGNTEKEARESFEIVLSEFLDYTTKHKTIDKELKRLGWTVSKKENKIALPEWNINKSIMERNFKKINKPLSVIA